MTQDDAKQLVRRTMENTFAMMEEQKQTLVHHMPVSSSSSSSSLSSSNLHGLMDHDAPEHPIAPLDLYDIDDDDNNNNDDDDNNSNLLQYVDSLLEDHDMLLPSPKEEEEQQQQQQQQQEQPPNPVSLVESPWIPRPQLAWAFSPIQLQQPTRRFRQLPLPPPPRRSTTNGKTTLPRDWKEELEGDDEDDITTTTDENRDPRMFPPNNINFRQHLLLVEMESEEEPKPKPKQQQLRSPRQMDVPTRMTTLTSTPRKDLPQGRQLDDDNDDDGRVKLPHVETRLSSHGSSKAALLPTTKETTMLPTTRRVVEGNDERIRQPQQPPTQQQSLWWGWSSSNLRDPHPNQSAVTSTSTTVIRRSPRRGRTVHTVTPFTKVTRRGNSKWNNSRTSSSRTRHANKKIRGFSLAVSSSTPTTPGVPFMTGAPEPRQPAVTTARPIYSVQVTPLKLSKGDANIDK